MATIILGVTGSIAAYKAADICSRLVKFGHEVHCVCTAKALEFITPLTLQTLSRNRVFSSFEDEKDEWMPPHIDLAVKADLFVVAPASANTISNMGRSGHANIYLSGYAGFRSHLPGYEYMDVGSPRHSRERKYSGRPAQAPHSGTGRGRSSRMRSTGCWKTRPCRRHYPENPRPSFVKKAINSSLFPFSRAYDCLSSVS